MRTYTTHHTGNCGIAPEPVMLTPQEVATLAGLRDGSLVAVPGDDLRRARRTAEMSTNIMRDAKRTGGWEGAEKVARQFERIADLLAAPAPKGDVP